MKNVWKTVPKTFGIAVAMVFAIACGNEPKTGPAPDSSNKQAGTTPVNEDAASNASDPKGEGKFTNVELTHPLDKSMIAAGQKIYDVKCSACHKLTDEKLVGPGWKGVTTRRKPEWIMNFVTNTDEMLNKDAQAMSLLEVCLVRMPNQNLSDAEARDMLEFMRNNDGDK